jgi:ATP-dependent Lhr-like helicase
MQTRLDFSRSAPPAPEGLFHPAVSGWLQSRFGQPTEVQTEAWKVTSQHRHALISAPTGSGKTLAAFLSAINDLVVEGLDTGLTDEVHVLYVSPLKALSNDIQKNLQEPLAGIRKRLVELGHPDLAIRDAVRTGDTPTVERERMRKVPPHILVTTPESLFILLTSDSGRKMLGSVRSVIVDELHAVAGSKRGAHLMLTLERLDALCAKPPVRIGLSATVKPLSEMAEFLVGAGTSESPPPPTPPSGGGEKSIERVAIIDAGHIRNRDLAIEMPRSPLTAVMATEVWSELYDRLAELIGQHRTTLIFVNQRRIAERAARHLAERIGEEHVTAHHGSLAKEHRHKAEQRLKSGELKALVATSALELGIDIGQIDLVCQLGSPRAINAFLQRVGRAGHAIGAVPKGRLFPLALDDLLECASLLDAVNHGELDRIRVPQKPLDVLAQQIVAETGCREWGLDELYERFRRAQPYRDLKLAEFEQVVQMLADGYSTRRGRRGAYLHFDAVNRVLRARRGAKLTAVTNAGTIPDQFDYEVVLMPEEHRIGTLNEDFAFESLPGDIFQLGNTSYRIAKVETGKVYVEDAKGQPPNMPCWFGDALGRTDELCHAVSRLSKRADELLTGSIALKSSPPPEGGAGGGVAGAAEAAHPSPQSPPARGGEVTAQGLEACEHWLREDVHLPAEAAHQISQYLAASKAALGVLPTEDTLVFERFFDEVGDTHLVIHSPYGSRINKAWGLALRKRFCRKFNFELQASALEDSIVLSLGPTHSFPLLEIKDYLKSTNARDVLVQALLAAPMFGTRWRWNASVALAVKRINGGKRVPPQFQRSDAEDLLTVCFPDQVACAENIVGDREIPDHPLVKQTIDDCIHETMDIDGFERLLRRMEAGEVRIVACDLASPSPLSHAILNARPYAFLDDGAAEERRTKAVRTQPLMDVQSASDLGRLDPQAIEQVRDEAWPEIGNADELHDALVVHAFLTAAELEKTGITVPDAPLLQTLLDQRRIAQFTPPNGAPLWIAAERLHELIAAFPEAVVDPVIRPVSTATPNDSDALREIVRSRMELLGPVTEAALAAPMGLGADVVQMALLQLEAEGPVMRGAFTSPSAAEWCDRRLLARMHRYTRERLRAEIQPVPPAQFMRFLFRWHQLADNAGDERREGDAGLQLALRQLEGCAAPAAAWEEDLLPSRIKHYLPYMLDKQCANGRIVWTRPLYGPASSGEDGKRKAGPIRTTPILLCERESLAQWQEAGTAPSDAAPLSPRAQNALESLRQHGASFFSDLVHDTGLLKTELEQALGELVSQGLVTCDSFAGLRALVMPAEKRNRLRRRMHRAVEGIDEAGRWSLTRRPRQVEEKAGALAAPHVEHIARVLLRRYGVVFRKLLEREDGLPPWRDLYYVYRRLEARGEVRGGRFVSGFSGEQFALPDAAAVLRKVAKTEGEERVSISAADPLNLVGILTPGEKVPRLPGNRVLFENGVPVAMQVGGEVRYLREMDEKGEWEVKNLLIRRQKLGSYFETPQRQQ